MSNQSSTSNDKQLTIHDIIREIEQKSKGGGYIYRGEHKNYPKVSSNLYREFGIEELHFDIEVVQKEMLNSAKKHIGHLPQDFQEDFVTLLRSSGKDTKDTDEIINLEILTELQHYGGNTNLIDFTTDHFISR